MAPDQTPPTAPRRNEATLFTTCSPKGGGNTTTISLGITKEGIFLDESGSTTRAPSMSQLDSKVSSRTMHNASDSELEKDAGEEDEVEEVDTLPFSKAKSIGLVATVTGAAFLNSLAAQAVVIILPTIGKDLDIPESRQQWVVSSYALTFGCFLLFWGRVADIYGKRLIFISGSIWITLIMAVQPFLPNEITFNLFRGLHGLGAAANVPTAIGIIGVTFPPGKAKTYAFSFYSSGAPLGNVFGNIVSGFIAQYANWKWVFGALAMMSAIICVAAFFVIPPPPPSALTSTSQVLQKPTIDWIGAILITIGLLALMFALTEGNVVGWDTAWVIAVIILSVVVIAGFVVWQWFLEKRLDRAKAQDMDEETFGTPQTESHTRNEKKALTPPLIKVSMFKNTQFSAAMFVMFFFFASFNDYFLYSTYFFQEYQGLSPLQTTLRFIPTGVGGATVSIIVALLLTRVPTLFILLSGHIAISIASLLYALPISPHTSYFARGLPAMLLAVIGADTTWPCMTLFTSRALPKEDQAVAGALINAVCQFGRAIGLAISTAVQTTVMANARHVSVKDVGGMHPWEATTLKGIRAASWVNFAYGVLALAFTLTAFRGMDIIGRPANAEKGRKTKKAGGGEGVQRAGSVTEVTIINDEKK